MKYSEAMKLLNEGKKVRRVEWVDSMYIYKNEEGRMMDNDGIYYSTSILTGEWEEYIEPTDNMKIQKLIDWHQLIDGTTDEEKIHIVWHKLNDVIDVLNTWQDAFNKGYEQCRLDIISKLNDVYGKK